ncbi:MAG: gamma-glutamyltransferase [Planctomycetota bacterium]
MIRVLFPSGRSRVGIVFVAVAIVFAQSSVAQSSVAQSSVAQEAHSASGRRGMVASVNPIATEAGLNALRLGGNAVDAAIATALTLGVVDGHNSGLGGGCFVLIRTADGRIVAIDGREMAPAAATRDMFVRDGKVVPGLSTTGPLAVGVPGALAAYDKALAAHGRLELASLLEPAADIAEHGFKIDRVYARKLKRVATSLAKFPASRAMLLRPDGEPYDEGEMLQLRDLAKTYRSIAQHGTDWFYRGEFASIVAGWMQANGGLLTEEDFANYTAKSRPPVRTRYRDVEVIGFPPPSSGGTHVAEILNILESFPIGSMLREDPAAATHTIAEAMKLAFADRAHWLGDSDFAKVPRGLVRKDYARSLAARIKTDRAIDVPSHGLPPDWETDLYGKHTTHIAAADDAGNWVAITATVNTTFGSKVVVPGTGLVLNNEMDDFSALPGSPNAFGLVGAEANAVAPGKRPLSSMSPTIVLRDGEPVLTVGGAGGPKIITSVLLAIVRSLDGKMEISESIAAPRFHHQWKPEKLFVERTTEESIVEHLRSLGHEVEFLTSAAVVQGIQRLPDGTFIGCADPRVPGKASGY